MLFKFFFLAKNFKDKQGEGNSIKNPIYPSPILLRILPHIVCVLEHFKADTMYHILNTVFNCPCVLRLPSEGTEPQKCTEHIKSTGGKGCLGLPTLTAAHCFFLTDLHERESFQLTA